MIFLNLSPSPIGYFFARRQWCARTNIERGSGDLRTSAADPSNGQTERATLRDALTTRPTPPNRACLSDIECHVTRLPARLDDDAFPKCHGRFQGQVSGPFPLTPLRDQEARYCSMDRYS